MNAISGRFGIAEDINHNPEHKRQREIARWLIGTLVNALGGARPVWEDNPNFRKLAKDAAEIALREGLVFYDEWHHAPMCRANNWSRQMLPSGPCSCGAERQKIR